MIHAPAKALLLFSAVLAALPVSAQAQGMPGPYGGGGWQGRGGVDSYDQRFDRQSAQPSRKIAVTAFRAADADMLLGKGRIVLRRPAAEAGLDSDGKLPVYEAAVIDELAKRGYDTATATDPGQTAEITVSHSVASPEEAPHRKVSGEMSTVFGNRGSGFGLGVNVDLRKPARAIVATRLDLRIRDHATGRVLWEGHAEGESREGESGLDNAALAGRLAGALLKRFPEGEVVQPFAAAVLP